MAVVTDANVLVAVSIDDARSRVAQEKMLEWAAADEQLHAPALALFEVASAFTGMLSAGMVSAAQIRTAALVLDGLPVAYHPMRDIPLTIEIASRLQRRSAYDAAYIALAEQMGAELWTFDGPLARNAASVGFPVLLMPMVTEP
ncbi:MAG: PIN domain-containing protein [Chloroflexi bacterium]|nr:PIN domain-containing protein [Chloroflexota bacterium]